MSHRQMVVDQFETAYRAASTIVRNMYSTDMITSNKAYEGFKSYRVDIAMDVYATYHGVISNTDLVIIQEHCETMGYNK